MNVKQKNLRVFEFDIDVKEDFIDYVNRNLILLKKFMLFVKGNVTGEILDFLESKSLLFIDIREKDLTTLMGSSKGIKTKVEPEIKYVKNQKLIFTKPLRSGEEVITAEDVVSFARINSGAKVKTEGNGEFFDKIDGFLEVNGEYLILKEINKGEVVFNGEVLDKKVFNGIIKRVTFVNRALEIKEL